MRSSTAITISALRDRLFNCAINFNSVKTLSGKYTCASLAIYFASFWFADSVSAVVIPLRASPGYISLSSSIDLSRLQALSHSG
jgi:hypothetical protein